MPHAGPTIPEGPAAVIAFLLLCMMFLPATSFPVFDALTGSVWFWRAVLIAFLVWLTYRALRPKV